MIDNEVDSAAVGDTLGNSRIVRDVYPTSVVASDGRSDERLRVTILWAVDN